MHRSELQRAHRLIKQEQGIRASKPLQVITYRGWIFNLYQDLQDREYPPATRTLITATALDLAFRQHAPNLDVIKHTHEVQNAWQLAWNWNLWSVWEDVTGTENGRVCATWFASIQRWLERNGLITEAELDGIVVKAIEEGILRLNNVTLFQFVDPTRMQRNLFGALERKGCKVIEIDHPQSDEAHGTLLSFESPEEEWNAIGAWARQQLSELPESARIGIVSSDRSADAIRRQFESTFAELYDVGQVVHLHSPRTLASTKHWLEVQTLLEWTTKALHHSELQPLGDSILFPNLEVPDAFGPENPEYIALATFVKRSDNPIISRNLSALLSRLRGRRVRTKPFRDYVAETQYLFQLAGWSAASPGTFTNLVQQAIAASLESLSECSGFLKNSSWSEFVRTFLANGGGSPINESNAEAPIHVLSKSEARGLQFDALWVCGLADTEWPATITPNAWLPSVMQRKAGVTRSTQIDELRFAEETTRGWYGATKNLVFSFAREDEDTEAEASKLIDLEVTKTKDYFGELHVLTQQSHPWEAVELKSPLEQYYNDTVSYLDFDETRKARTSLLRNHANCPFKSWAENRLRLEEDETPPETFPSPSDRGTLYHEVIKLLCLKARTPDAFKKLAREGQKIENAIDKVFSAKEYRRFPKIAANQEKATIKRMVEAWLLFQGDSDFDFEIIATEQKKSIEFGGYKFEVYVDRVQETPVVNEDSRGVGHRAKQIEVFDLKTGKVSASSWDLRRLEPSNGQPIETQLPLYAQLKFKNKEVRGIGYDSIDTRPSAKDHAKSTNGVICSQQIARQVDDRGNVASKGAIFLRDVHDGDFDEFRSQWNDHFEDLMVDFRNGNALPTPRKSICEYCTFVNMCRQFG